jgi:hypothetical protein
VWVDFDRVLATAASELPTATVVDAGRGIEDVEHDVRQWINMHLTRRNALPTESTP